MVIRLVIDFGELVKMALKKGREGVSEWVESWGLLGFMALVCVWVYFCCCSGGCLCREFQRAGVVCSWYSRLVSRW
jgi:hypothetical protein